MSWLVKWLFQNSLGKNWISVLLLWFLSGNHKILCFLRIHVIFLKAEAFVVELNKIFLVAGLNGNTVGQISDTPMSNNSREP